MPSESFRMTSFKDRRLLLISVASFYWASVGLDFLTRSEPARSTKLILAEERVLVVWLNVCTMIEKMKCERDESSFMAVQAVLRWRTPNS